MKPQRILVIFGLPAIVGVVILWSLWDVPLPGGTLCFGDWFRGVRDARKDLAAGNPHLVFTGLPVHNGLLDGKTGLPTESIGCWTSAATDAYCQGYNEQTGVYFRSGKLAQYSLIHQVMTRSDVDSLFALGKWIEVTTATREIDLPEAGLRIEVRTERSEDGVTVAHYRLLDGATGLEKGKGVSALPARLALASERGVVVIRDGHYRQDYTYDVVTGRWLQFLIED